MATPLCAVDSDCRLSAVRELSDLYQLRDLYRQDWPLNCVGYYCLDNFIRWRQHEPEIKHLQIFTLNDNWRESGLFVIVDRYQLFINCLDDYDKDNQLLTKAIELLDWSHGYKVSSFRERHRSAVLRVVKAKQLSMEYDSLTVMYYMPVEEALKMEIVCPAGYSVRPMIVADAECIDELWPNRHQGSLFLIRRLITWNANMGVYVMDTNELVAWCLRLQGGFLGALQVKNSHRRLGLGHLVAQATSRQIAKMGHDVMALVNKDNVASRSLFDKLGFRVTSNCYWLRTYPTEQGYEWPDGE